MPQDLPYHRAAGLLGIGDLHPGGAPVSEELVAWLGPWLPGRVLEVGAGMGMSTERLQQAGARVTAVEPDPVLRKLLITRTGIEVHAGDLASVETTTPFDAVFAESVLYSLEPSEAVAQVAGLLRPGGAFCWVDMVWTTEAEADGVAELHARSDRLFGIPVAARKPWTWAHWREALEQGGFDIAQERRLDPARDPGPSRPGRLGMVKAAAKAPEAAVRWKAMGRTTRGFKIPSGWTESWACLAVRRGASSPGR